LPAFGEALGPDDAVADADADGAEALGEADGAEGTGDAEELDILLKQMVLYFDI
jgi:hypothetical protein